MSAPFILPSIRARNTGIQYTISHNRLLDSLGVSIRADTSEILPSQVDLSSQL